MKKKHLFVLFSILAVLLVVGLAKRAHKSAQFEKQTVASALEVKFDKALVEKIRFKKSDSASYELIRKNGEWQIPSLWNTKGDAPKIGNLLEKLLGLSGDLRADSENVLSDFEIKDPDAFHLILLGVSDQELAHFLISYKAPQSGGSFVRLKDSNAVYLTEENLFSELGIFGDAKTQELKAGYWAHLKYLTVDPTKTESVLVKKMNGAKEAVIFDLRKELEKWNAQGVQLPFPVASEKIYRFLGQFTQGLAREVVDPDGKYGLDQPDWILTVKETDKEAQTVRIKSSEDKNADFVYVSLFDSNSVLKVSSSVIQSINVEPSYFEPTTPFLDEMKNWQVVRIKTQEKSTAFKKETSGDGKTVWKVEGQETQPDQQKIEDYMKSIEGLQIVQYLQVGKELPKDLGSISIEMENGAGNISKLDISSVVDSGGNYIAVKSGFQLGFVISKLSIDKILSLPQ